MPRGRIRTSNKGESRHDLEGATENRLIICATGIIQVATENRWIIYAIGIILLFLMAVYLPTFVKQPQNWVIPDVSPYYIGYLLLLLNLISTLARRKEYVDFDKKRKNCYKRQADRIKLIQEYGSVVLTAGSVIAAISTIARVRTMSLILVYLGASVILATVALVPIWMSEFDYRPLLILRHFKTMVLTLAVAWLSQAVIILLQENVSL